MCCRVSFCRLRRRYSWNPVATYVYAAPTLQDFVHTVPPTPVPNVIAFSQSAPLPPTIPTPSSPMPVPPPGQTISMSSPPSNRVTPGQLIIRTADHSTHYKGPKATSFRLPAFLVWSQHTRNPCRHHRLCRPHSMQHGRNPSLDW